MHMYGRGRHGLCIPPPRRAARRRVLWQVIYAATDASLSVQVQVQVQVSSLRRGRSARQLRYRPPCMRARAAQITCVDESGRGGPLVCHRLTLLSAAVSESESGSSEDREAAVEDGEETAKEEGQPRWDEGVDQRDKLSFRRARPASATLYVRGLPQGAGTADVQRVFGRWGECVVESLCMFPPLLPSPSSHKLTTI